MGVYVEITCDIASEARFDGRLLCQDSQINSPQGQSIKSALKAARAAGWLITKTQHVCPFCTEEAHAANALVAFARKVVSGGRGGSGE